MTLYCFDANVLIRAWLERYPIDVFPSLYPALCNLRKTIVLIEPMYREIHPRPQGVRAWIDGELKVEPTPMGQQAEALASELVSKYTPRPPSTGKGVSQKDLWLIAFAKENDLPVVTFEAPQPQAPERKLFNYKIPLVCQTEAVEWLDFVEYLRREEVRI